jgi:transglutaminase-like putative cysteine protease
VRTSVAVDADVTVIADSRTATSNPEVQVSLLRSRSNLRQDSVYQVVSRVTNAAPESLRLDHTDYPQWIRERYLQVPDDLPRRVRRLARQLTEGYDNPYDMATAVESYLRTIRYDTEIAAPPAGVDAVAYFLFDVQAGYCDYYASAMAMLLRSQGIPVRFVAGYAPGEYDSETARYTVREENAHAWVEVFFPTYGWVQFEPTASEPNISRPLPNPVETAGMEPLDPGLIPEEEFMNPWQDRQLPDPLLATAATQVSWFTGLRPYLEELGLVLLVLTAAAIAWLVLRKRERRILLPDTGLVLRLFGLLSLWAERLRIPWPASHTPLEHAHAFAQVMPEAEQPVQRLAGLLVAQQYGREVIASETLVGAASEWREIQPVLWRRWATRLLNINFRRPGSPAKQDQS